MCSRSMTKVCLSKLIPELTLIHPRTDGNGRITSAELAEVVHAVDPKSTPEQVTKMVKAVDIDGNGTIDFLEFLSMMSTIGSVESGQDLIEEFKEFDKNGDGLVSVSELKYVMGKLGALLLVIGDKTLTNAISATKGERLSDEQVNEIVRMADADGDGYINYHGVYSRRFTC